VVSYGRYRGASPQRSPFEICNECRTELGIFNGTPVGAAGMGAFEVPADKITAWRDYFYVEA
jgi:hypothetical protein